MIALTPPLLPCRAPFRYLGCLGDDRREDFSYSSGMALQPNIPAVPPNVVPLN